MRTKLWSTWLFLTAATWSLPVWAEADAERLKTAAEEFDAGRRAYRLRDFENAAVHFENADRDVQSPEALLSAMRARKEAGHDAKAATLAAWALTRYPADKEIGENAPKLIAEVEKFLHKITLSCSPDCALVVDSKVAPFGETTTATLYLDPGKHALVAGWPNDRHQRADVDTMAGSSSNVSFSAPAAVAVGSTPLETGATSFAPDNDRPRPSGLPPAVFFGGVGATLIMAGVTTWSGLDTIKNPGKDAVARCAPRDTSCPAYQLGLSHQNRTNVLIGATSVVAAATAVVGLFFTNWGGGKSSEAFIVPALTAGDGIAIGAVGRF